MDNMSDEEMSDSGDQGSSELDGVNATNSEVESSPSEGEEFEPVATKKVTVRKPSKRAVETAMNEVGDDLMRTKK